MYRSDGGQAFPGQLEIEEGDEGYIRTEWHPGMSLRQHYAGIAMQALIASVAETWEPGFEKVVAKRAFEFADAMLEARQ